MTRSFPLITVPRFFQTAVLFDSLVYSVRSFPSLDEDIPINFGVCIIVVTSTKVAIPKLAVTKNS